MDRTAGVDGLERKIARLTMAVTGLGLLWIATLAFVLLREPAFPPVLSVERLEILEPDGNLAFAFAASGQPTAGTLDGEVLLSDQVDERRFPHFIYFDGRGDEVGGLVAWTVDGPDGTSVSRFLTFDGYKHQEVLVLGHNEGPTGSTTGLRIIAHEPGATLIGALEELGLSTGVTRAELQSAIEALPPDERQRIMRRFGGALRVQLGTALDGEAGLTLLDAQARPRIILAAPADGEPTLRFLDENGETILRLPAAR